MNAKFDIKFLLAAGRNFVRISASHSRRTVSNGVSVVAIVSVLVAR